MAAWLLLAGALVRGQVVDAETGAPLPCRIRIVDAAGHTVAPEGHAASPAVEIGPGRQRDVIASELWAYAMLPDGRFEVRAPEGARLRAELVHGFEYERPSVDLPSAAGPRAVTLPLRRLSDARARGWISGDTHVHTLDAAAAWEEGLIEDVGFVNLMSIGRDAVARAGRLGRPVPPSDARCQVVYSQEVRDHDYGHLTLVGVQHPVEPVATYSGTGKQLQRRDLPPLPNEPRNDETYDAAHAAGGLVAQAHFSFWPGFGVAASAALGKLDAVELVGPDPLAVRGAVQAPGFRVLPKGETTYPSDIQLYYDMLNSGCRLAVWGGTDLMGNDRLVGHARTYAHVGAQRDVAAWTAALRAGHTFATNHPLVFLSVDGKEPGDEIAAAGPVRVHAHVTLQTAFPVTTLRLVKNGVTEREIAVSPSAHEAELSVDVAFDRSGWLAAAAFADHSTGVGLFNDAWAWSHTSPVYVTIASQPAAVAPGPERLLRHMDAVLEWAGKEAMFTSPGSRGAALATFTAARDVYVRAQERARH